MDEATPSAIEKAKTKWLRIHKLLMTNKSSGSSSTDVNQQQAVVEKSKETNAAKVQNDKDQQAVTAAKQEQAKLEELAKMRKWKSKG